METFPGTENRRTGEFEITGDTFRISHEARVDNPDDFAAFSTDVLDEGNGLVDFTLLLFEDDEDSSNVLEGPGTFRLEIGSENFEYVVTVEDCAGNEDGGNDNDNREPTRSEPTTLRPPEPTRSKLRPPLPKREPTDVVLETIPNKPLPPTGGLPISVVVAGFILTGAGLVALGLGMRRGRRR